MFSEQEKKKEEVIRNQMGTTVQRMGTIAAHVYQTLVDVNPLVSDSNKKGAIALLHFTWGLIAFQNHPCVYTDSRSHESGAATPSPHISSFFPRNRRDPRGIRMHAVIGIARRD